MSEITSLAALVSLIRTMISGAEKTSFKACLNKKESSGWSSEFENTETSYL